MKSRKLIILLLAVTLSIMGCAGGTNSSKETSTEFNKDEAKIDSEIEETPITDFEYEYDAETEGIKITKYVGNSINVIIPNEIEEQAVTYIGKDAFKESGIKTVVIPDSVKEIGENAFRGCKGLTEIELPKNLSYIGTSAFSESCLKEIYVDAKKIGNTAFWNCESLTKVTIGDNVTEIGTSIFNGCNELMEVSIGNGLKEIPEKAFYECLSLKKIEFGNSIETVGKYSFSNCSGLEEVIIPDNVVDIQSRAFEQCSSLKKAVIGNGVNTIEGTAFIDCVALSELQLGKNVSVLGFSAFSGCKSLTNVSLPDSVSDIGPASTYGSNGTFGDCKNIMVTYKGNIYTYANIDDLYGAINGDKYSEEAVPTK